jgi:hypothetical protein
MTKYDTPTATDDPMRAKEHENLDLQTADKLAEELEACAEESARLDERMLRVRERIAQN